MLKITRHKGGRGLAGGAGLQGPQGLKGDQGIAGIAGVAGAKGDQGIAGVAGAIGVQGVAGAVGEGFYEAMVSILNYGGAKPEFLSIMMEGIQASRAQSGRANTILYGGQTSVLLANVSMFDTIIRRDWDLWFAYMKAKDTNGVVNFVTLVPESPYTLISGGGYNAAIQYMKLILNSYAVPIASVQSLLNAVKSDVALNINSNTEVEGGQTATVIYEVMQSLQFAILNNRTTELPAAEMPACISAMNPEIANGNINNFKTHYLKVIERILKNLEEISIEYGFGNIDNIAANKQIQVGATNSLFSSIVANIE
jgi:Collagen triple helix repeat (20 copies)